MPEWALVCGVDANRKVEEDTGNNPNRPPRRAGIEPRRGESSRPDRTTKGETHMSDRLDYLADIARIEYNFAMESGDIGDALAALQTVMEAINAEIQYRDRLNKQRSLHQRANIEASRS